MEHLPPITPGPWERGDEAGSRVSVLAGRLAIAVVNRGELLPPAQAQANLSAILVVPTMLAAVQMGMRMRRFQGDYFKTRSQDALRVSKECEREFDRLCQRIEHQLVQGVL